MYFNYVQYSLVILFSYRTAVETSKPIENNRILYGGPAASNIPYQVALYISKPGKTTFCSGSIITTKFVLSAAHCLSNATSVKLIFKAHSLAKARSQQTDIMQSGKIKIHESWNSLLPIANNIALIELPDKLKLSTTLTTVMLPNKWSKKLTYIGKKTKISGWGVESNREPVIRDVIRILNVQIVAPNQCSNRHVLSTNLCGFGKGGGNACIGDDGGPLVVKINGTTTQIGIILFDATTPFCLAALPHIFTKVVSFLDWIRRNSDYDDKRRRKRYK